MGWNNYILLDTMKIQIEVSRNIREDVIEDLEKKFNQIIDTVDELTIHDIPFEKDLGDYATHLVKHLGFLTQNLVASALDGTDLLSYMVILWLNTHAIPYRIVSEYNRTEKEEKYHLLSRWNE